MLEDIILAFYDGVDAPDGFVAAIARLGQHFGCPSAVLFSVEDGHQASGEIVAHGSFTAPVQALYQREFAGMDPAPAAFARLAPGQPGSTDRLFDATIRARHPFVQEFYRPLGLVEAMAVSLAPEPDRHWQVAVHRGPDRAAFNDQEHAHFARLAPHIRRALQLRRAMHRLQARLDAVSETADRAASGIVVLNARGAAIHVNVAARRLALRETGFWLEPDGAPACTDPKARRAIAAAIDDVARGGAGATVRIPRSPGHATLLALVAPLRGAARDPDGRTLIILHDPDRVPPNLPGVLGGALGLPPGPTALVLELLDGGTLASFAAGRGISPETARFHLRTAFDRLGVRRQVDLVRAALRVAHDFGLEREAD